MNRRRIPQKGANTSKYQSSYFRAWWKRVAGGLSLPPSGSAFLLGKKVGHHQPGPVATVSQQGDTVGGHRAVAAPATPPGGPSMCEQHFDIWPLKGKFSKPPFMDPTHRSSKQKKSCFPNDLERWVPVY
jgi:hypothetical protein